MLDLCEKLMSLGNNGLLADRQLPLMKLTIGSHKVKPALLLRKTITIPCGNPLGAFFHSPQCNELAARAAELYGTDETQLTPLTGGNSESLVF